MPLTAQEHQKIAVLQQVANLVGQAQSVAGNQSVLNNVINNVLPLVNQWSRSDPEFQELASQMRRARSGNSPHYLTNIAGQAQRMISLIRTGLPYRVNREGERMEWDPVRGWITSPMFDPNEPVRTFSPMGWRGSQKYPFGKAFPEKNVIEGWGDLNEFSMNKVKGALLGLGAGILVGIVTESFSEGIDHPILRKVAAPAASSVAALGIYWFTS